MMMVVVFAWYVHYTQVTTYDIRLFQDVFNDCQCCSMLCHVIFWSNMYSSKVITKRDVEKIQDRNQDKVGVPEKFNMYSSLFNRIKAYI